MFDGEHILIVEDEPLVALDLAETVTDLGGLAVGPFASVREALTSLEQHNVAGAILDATLLDRDITPVATHLAELGVPIVIHSGVGVPRELAALHPDLPTVPKPAVTTRVVERLAEEMQRKRERDLVT